MSHFRSLVLVCIASLALVSAPIVEVAAMVGRSIRHLLDQVIITTDSEIALGEVRRLTLWDKVVTAGLALKDFARRALTHARYTGGMFSAGAVGGPQHLAM